MEPAIRKALEDFDHILAQFEEAMGIPASQRNSRDRDSAILRFELSYEVCWKLLQRLVRAEGYESNGPRSALEKAFALGWIQDEAIWYDIIKDRNTAVHVYREDWAQALFDRLPAYLIAFRHLRAALPV
ncbi:MAG: nucleotidyltransferase substrate binding protein [Opitutales bacterium]|nr:nucleotidyltransferase substrate binding protein [Opitutales bacterium]MCH8539596.1 nucleotidyltransferase substrate binding protein [Opitutales bacterium]